MHIVDGALQLQIVYFQTLLMYIRLAFVLELLLMYVLSIHWNLAAQKHIVHILVPTLDSVNVSVF
jgi:hypothetical protein